MDHDMEGGASGPQCEISMLWNWNTINACFIARSWRIKSHGMFAGSCIGVILLVMLLEFLRRLGKEYDGYLMMRQQHLSQIALRSRESFSDVPRPRETGSQTQRPGETKTAAVAEGDGVAVSTSASSEIEEEVKPAAVKEPQQPHPNVPVASASAQLAGNIRSRMGYQTGPASCADDAQPIGSQGFRPSVLQQMIRALLHTMQFAVAYFVMLLAMYYNGYFIICIFIGAFIGSFIFSWEQIGKRRGSSKQSTVADEATICCG